MSRKPRHQGKPSTLKRPIAVAGRDEDAFLRLDPEWQRLCQVISEADLDDRSCWSEPIEGDPWAALTRSLNG